MLKISSVLIKSWINTKYLIHLICVSFLVGIFFVKYQKPLSNYLSSQTVITNNVGDEPTIIINNINHPDAPITNISFTTNAYQKPLINLSITMSNKITRNNDTISRDTWYVDWQLFDTIRIKQKSNIHNSAAINQSIKWENENFIGYCRHFLHTLVAFPYFTKPNTEMQLLYNTSLKLFDTSILWDSMQRVDYFSSYNGRSQWRFASVNVIYNPFPKFRKHKNL